MIRIACLAALVAGLLLPTAPAVPVPKERGRSQNVDLTGTTWEGPDGPLGVVRFVFEPNGLLFYAYENGATFRNGTWKSDGDVITFEINQGSRHFRGTVRGDSISGNSWNQQGTTWTTTMRRMTPPK